MIHINCYCCNSCPADCFRIVLCVTSKPQATEFTDLLSPTCVCEPCESVAVGVYNFSI